MRIYLAGAALDDDESVLADGTGLLRVGLGRPSVGLRLEVVLLGVRHGYPCNKPKQQDPRISLDYSRSQQAKQIRNQEHELLNSEANLRGGGSNSNLVWMDHEEAEEQGRDGEAQMISDKLAANPRVWGNLYC